MLSWSAPQFVSQFQIVIDLAIVGDPVPSPVGHRLVSGAQINDAETAVCETHVGALVLPHPDAVWSAMALEVVHYIQLVAQLRNRFRPEMKESCNTTHSEFFTPV